MFCDVCGIASFLGNILKNRLAIGIKKPRRKVEVFYGIFNVTEEQR